MAMFFHDVYGGDFIAVAWKSSAFEPKPFKVTNVQCRVPKTGQQETKLKVDVNAVLEDFQVLGQGIVKTVEVVTEKWNIE
ncbi:nucleolar protein 6-like [Saccoglossus kowalevskii]|uniref:Nucleolar protein 6 n=1 Tax=Saccoglossus kowalevskii TaxID=10224 RepID=A0ABM0GZ21_SACKO|nr:PREDICTED: nucleolar protein 6-like [Saccoglossus kowalevskii]